MRCRPDTDTGLVILPSNPKFSAFLNFGQTYVAGAWRELLFNNTRHNDQLAAAIAGNVLTFTAPAAGTYLFGVGATYEDTGGSAPTKMQVGLSVNGALPTGDRIGTAGDATITGGETQAQVTALLQIGQRDEVNPKIFFTSNDGRVLADENFFWGCLVA